MVAQQEKIAMHLSVLGDELAKSIKRAKLVYLVMYKPQR